MSDCAVEENPWQPVDYLQQLKDIQTTCSEVMELLEWKATTEAGKIWAHHLPKLLDAIGFFRDLCGEEIEHYGEWRYHGFQVDEVVDFIEEDLGELTPWICRITGEQTPLVDEDC